MLSCTTLRISTKGLGGYVSSQGYFFMYDPDNRQAHLVGTCRDVFRWYWEFTNAYEGSQNHGTFKDPISPYVGIACGSTWDIKGFAARWRSMERSLRLTRYTQVHRTSVGGAMILKVSPFWLTNDTRRSLLTLLVRALVLSPSKPIDQAIDLYPLGRLVKPAVKRFLSGHTSPSYGNLRRVTYDQQNRGFVAQFIRRSDASLKKLLVKPSVESS